MLFTAKMPQAAAQACLAALDEELLRTCVVGLGGRAQSRDYCSYLWHHTGPARLPRNALPGIPFYFGAPTSRAQSQARLDDFLQFCRERPEEEAILLLLGRGRQAGRVEGAVFRRPDFHPLDRCQLLPADPLLGLPAPIQPEERRRYSRVIGGLGTDVWGEVAWPRLRDARWCLVGAGRGGTALAMLLAQQGALYLTIIDPDQIEEHNLDGLPAPSTVVGSSKAEMLSFLLQRFRPELTAYAIPHSLVTLPAMEALWEADIIVSLVDSEQVRLIVSAIAAAYLKPYLDVGQSVVAARGRERELGVDVRLIIPGQGCLQCIGGAGDLSLAMSMNYLVRTPRMESDFREQRAGSLASLASIAVGLGMRLIEDMLVGVRSDSTWLRLVQRGSRIELQELPVRPGSSCPICASTTGLGDAAPLVGRRDWE